MRLNTEDTVNSERTEIQRQVSCFYHLTSQLKMLSGAGENVMLS